MIQQSDYFVIFLNIKSYGCAQDFVIIYVEDNLVNDKNVLMRVHAIVF